MRLWYITAIVVIIAVVVAAVIAVALIFHALARRRDD